MRGHAFLKVVIASSVWFLGASSRTFADESGGMGKIRIHVEPKQAYVFVDGKAIRDGNQTIPVSAGTHELGVYNYGFIPKTQKVHVGAGETTELRVSLQSSGDKITGPFGAIEFKGDPRAAVLLNGETPAYFVGHVDEFNWNWIWHQRLLVKPGTYQVKVVREGNTIWSGPVTATAGKRVIVYLDQNGHMKTVDWKEGLKMGPQPRFYAGVASATVPVASVESKLSVSTDDLSCGQSTELDWKTTDATDATISELGNVPLNGERNISPAHNTTYVLTSKGPGGESKSSVTVNVNATPTASVSLSEPEVRYHKIGDKVVEQDSATLQWSAANANSASLDPYGTAAMAGSKTIKADPDQTSTGAINEKRTYTLTATNACGGTTTKSATLHILGSIDPPPTATLASIFYPTAYPTKHHPKAGLVAGEEMALENAATQFKNFELYKNGASLVIIGHADVRGSEAYNKRLSERRAELVKEFLASHGVSSDQITVRSVGKGEQIDRQQVAALQAKDDESPKSWMKKAPKATWLAYNRRVDVVLEPTGQQSTKMYPNSATNARLLWQESKPSLKSVSAASKTERHVQQASNHVSGN
jgi:OmpA family/PEGA domain